MRMLYAVLSCVLFAAGVARAEAPPCDRGCEGVPCSDSAECGDMCECRLKARAPDDMPELGPPGVCTLKPGQCMDIPAPVPLPPTIPPMFPMPEAPELPGPSASAWGYRAWYFEQRVFMPGVPPHWGVIAARLRRR